MKSKILLSNCKICPRQCGADRISGQLGYCGAKDSVKAALASIHKFEEPCISGTRGSGTVFFSHCNMRCVFCQNFNISNEGFGETITIERLKDIFLEQQEKGVHNINLVSGAQYLPQICESLELAKENGLQIPVVYNSNGYETAESLSLLKGLVDVYLPDLKYYDTKLSTDFSDAPDYFEKASDAILEMVSQTGPPIFNLEGLIQKGTIVRHLVLPGCRKDSQKVLDWIKGNLGNSVYVSLLNQYTPMYHAKEIKQLSRKLTTFEYQSVVDYFLEIGLTQGYMQKRASATSAYTPHFNLEGILESTK